MGRTPTFNVPSRADYIATRRAVMRAADMVVPSDEEIGRAYDRAFPPIPPTPMTPEYYWAMIAHTGRRNGPLYESFGDISRNGDSSYRFARVTLRECIDD